MKLLYFRSNNRIPSFIQISVEFQEHDDGFLATLYLGHETFTGTGSNHTSAKDNASEEALKLSSFSLTPPKKEPEKTPVTELNELCQRLKQVCT